MGANTSTDNTQARASLISTILLGDNVVYCNTFSWASSTEIIVFIFLLLFYRHKIPLFDEQTYHKYITTYTQTQITDNQTNKQVNIYLKQLKKM